MTPMHQPAVIFQVPDQSARAAEMFVDAWVEIESARLGLDPATVNIRGAQGVRRYRATPDDLRRAAEEFAQAADRIEAAEIVQAANLPAFN